METKNVRLITVILPSKRCDEIVNYILQQGLGVISISDSFDVVIQDKPIQETLGKSLE